MTPSELRLITVAVFGGPGTGKKTLRSRLDGFKYTRRQDKRVFVFSVFSGAEGAASISLVLIDANHPPTDLTASVGIAKSVAQHCFLLFTKIDLIPSEPFERRLQYMQSERSLSFRYNVDYLSANLAEEGGVNSFASQLVDKLIPPPMPMGYRLMAMLDSIGAALLDGIAACFALPPGSNASSKVDVELASLGTQDNLIRLAGEATSWDENLKKRLGVEWAWSVRIHRITPSLVVKRTDCPSERAAMEFARQHTTIPVPRTFHPHFDSDWLLMEYVDGDMLRECWGRLSALMQFRIACTLRLYLKQLRRLRGSAVGAIDTGHVEGPFFQEGVYGPFASVHRFRRFCDWAAYEGWARDTFAMRATRETLPLCPPRLAFDWTPTFVHGDLNASNIVLDRRGTLWILDWGAAGFYPPSIERAAMQFVDDHLNPGIMPASWSRYRSFITGTYDSDKTNYWWYVYNGIDRFLEYAVQT